MVKFLIIRFSSIGDIVLTTPVIRTLKTQVEGAEIHFLTKDRYTEILEANPYISKIYAFSDNLADTIQALKIESYDYIIDLHNSLRSRRVRFALKRMYFSVNKLNVRKWLYVHLKLKTLPNIHIVDRYMDTIKAFITDRDSSGLDYFIPGKDEVDTASLGNAFSGGYVAFAIGAQHATKILPAEKIIDIIDRLDYPVILIGGPEDAEKAERIINALPGKKIKNACGKWNISQSASVIRQAGCVIGHDSGMNHIAAAFQKKLITVWGNTTPLLGMSPYMPHEESVNFEINGLKCRPCSKLGKDSCPKKHFKCMMDHDTAEIAATARRLAGA